MKKDKLFTWQTLLLMLFGVAVNYGGSQLALFLELPLFLDSIGTISVAALGGVLPGIIVGFTTNYLNSISDPITLYYAILSVLIAISAAWFALRGSFYGNGAGGQIRIHNPHNLSAVRRVGNHYCVRPVVRSVQNGGAPRRAHSGNRQAGV